MKLTGTKLHGFFDYLIGVFMIISPWILNFAHIKIGHVIPVIMGIIVLVTSIFTNYEFGIFRSINLSTHLTMDLITGMFIAASPWIFAFNDEVYVPHLVFGILVSGVALFTDKTIHAVKNVTGKLRHDKTH
jgi:hypothetical protein